MTLKQIHVADRRFLTVFTTFLTKCRKFVSVFCFGTWPSSRFLHKSFCAVFPVGHAFAVSWLSWTLTVLMAQSGAVEMYINLLVFEFILFSRIYFTLKREEQNPFHCQLHVPACHESLKMRTQRGLFSYLLFYSPWYVDFCVSHLSTRFLGLLKHCSEMKQLQKTRLLRAAILSPVWIIS